MRSVLMFTTAGNTLPTAKTDGSEAGSDWAKQDVDRARIEVPTMNKLRARLALSTVLPAAHCLFRVRTRTSIFLIFIAQPSNEALLPLSTRRGATVVLSLPFIGHKRVATDLPRCAIVGD